MHYENFIARINMHGTLYNNYGERCQEQSILYYRQ